MRARVGAMPQPKSGHHDPPPGRGGHQARVQSGMTLQDLKRQTALRLATDGESPNDESSDIANAAIGATGADHTAAMQYSHHARQYQGHPRPREPPYKVMSPQNAPQYQQHRGYGYGGAPPVSYSSDSRNYTDSQLGIGGGAGRGTPRGQFASPSQPHHHQNYRPTLQPLEQQYSTPRMPRHATVLKDRGSAENSVGSDPSGGSESAGYASYQGGNRNPKAASSPSMKGGHRTGSYGRNLDRAGTKASGKPKEKRSPDGRHTPVRDQPMEGQVLFATPNQRREVPSAPYTEPSRRSRHHQNMSPNFNQARSPDHYAGNYSNGRSVGYHSRNQPSNNPHQSKLPHGLTVQELKEMTRARLAAETDAGGPEGSSDQSVHSAGTHSSSKASDQYLSGRGSNLGKSNESMTRNLVQSNESMRRNQGMGSQPFLQGQLQNIPQFSRPRHPSPVFGAVPAPNPDQFNGNQPPHQRQTSPAFGLNSSQTKSLGETFETASAASRDLHTPADSAFLSGNSNSAGASSLPFTSPSSDPNSMAFNRTRCFSAEAGVPTSFERHQAAYYDSVPLAGTANRQRCATASPPGMTRLHEDRPFLFSTDDKERLAIPPLSEPRMRLHSTGGLNTQGTAVRAYNSSFSPPPNIGSGSAFVPIGGKPNDQFLLQSPPPQAMDRSKFGIGDRAVSSSSAASGHGDLPSSMAEAVLESLTSTTGPPIGGSLIGSSPFRPTEQELTTASRSRVSTDSDNASSAFRVDSLVPESSGSLSLFSSGESKTTSSHDNSGERMLLGTLSWGGEDDASQSNMGLSHDFGNLLNIGGNAPALRGRAATEPSWFGGNDPHLLVSRQDPEHNEEAKGPPRVSSLVDTKAPTNFDAAHQQGGGYRGF